MTKEELNQLIQGKDEVKVMTQADKELLLKDLSARLSYRVKLRCGGVLIGKIHQRYMKEICDTTLYSITEVYDNCYAVNARYDLIEIKPYLRPMSSMTEEEKKEFKKIVYDSMNIDNISASVYVADWLYSKHLDVHGLIPKGLAVEVTEENNPYERID